MTSPTIRFTFFGSDIRNTVLILSGIFLFAPLSSQTKAELERQFREQEGRKQATTAIQLAEMLKSDSIERAIYYGNLARNTGEKTEDIQLLQKVYLLDAQIANIQGNYYKSIDLCLKCLYGTGVIESRDSANAYCELALALSELGAHELAIRNQHKAVNIISRLGDTAGEYYWTGDIGKFYLRKKDIKQALHTFKKTENLASNMQDTTQMVHAYNNIGFTFSEMGQTDSSLIHYQSAIQLLDIKSSWSRQDSHLFSTVNGNIGDYWFAREDYYKALGFHKIGKKYVDNWNHSENADRHLSVALCYLNMGKLSEAKSSVDSCLKIAEIHNLDPVVANALLLNARIEQKLGNVTNALEFMQKHNTLLEQLRSEHASRQQEELTKALATYYNIQVQNQLDQSAVQSALMEEKIRVTNLRLLLVAIAAIFIGLVFILIILIQKRKASLANVEQQLKELEIQQVKYELDQKKQGLTNLAIDLSWKKQIEEELTVRLKEILQAKPEERESMIRSLLLNKQQVSKIDERLNQTRDSLEATNTEFFDKLENRFPNLTKNEKLLCSLIRQDLTNKEIASIRNVTPKAARMARYRLRIKLGLPEGSDVAKFLQEI